MWRLATPEQATAQPVLATARPLEGGVVYEGQAGRFHTIAEAAEPLTLDEREIAQENKEKAPGEYVCSGQYEAVCGKLAHFALYEGCKDPSGKRHRPALLIVNETGVLLDYYGLKDVRCIDVNRADDYKELALIYYGGHLSECLTIIRYDGESVWLMCENVLANRYLYYSPESFESADCVTLNGEGIVTVPSHRFDPADPVVVDEVLQERNGILEKTPCDGFVENRAYRLRPVDELFFREGAFDDVNVLEDLCGDPSLGNGLAKVKAGSKLVYRGTKDILDEMPDGDGFYVFETACYVELDGTPGFLYDLLGRFTELY